jgi:hypothetical protein
MSARAVATLPATAKDAEVAAIRLGSGSGFAAAVKQAAELLERGELDPSHPWPAALVWRRVQDLRGVEALRFDSVLAPLFEIPAAAGVLRSVASRDPSGTLTRLADELGFQGAFGAAAEQLARDLAAPPDSSWPAELTDAYERARVRAGDEFTVLEKLGYVSRTESIRARLRFELDYAVGKLEPPRLARLPQWVLDALYFDRRTGRYKVRELPSGKGRRPGARNSDRTERLNGLAARVLATPEPWELVLSM